jgi:hypothetical protein
MMGAPFYVIKANSLCYNLEIPGNLVLKRNCRETRISVCGV